MEAIEKSLYEYFADAVAENGDKRYMFDETRTFSFREVFGADVSAANSLRSLGMGKGCRAALLTARNIETAIAIFATQFAGITAALADPRDGVSGAASYDCIITPRDGRLYAAIGGKERELRTDMSAVPCFDTRIDVHAPALIVFTSGSTGGKKGVMLSQYNYMNHIRNYSEAGCYYPDDISMEVLPLDHVFGLTVIFMGLFRRYEILFPASVRPDYVADCIVKHGITRMDGVPSFAQAIANENVKRGGDIVSLRTAVTGGAYINREQFDFIEKTLGLDIVPVYGMSECIGITGVGKSASADVRSTCVGKLLPMNEGRIADDGEICVKAPAVMIGYYNDERATAAAIDGDGYLHTGDIGYFDGDGYLHITGRKKDIIIRNGNNLSTVEIEQKILSSGLVGAVAVVGVPDASVGEAPAAAVVLSDACGESEFVRKITLLLTKIEMPVSFTFLTEMPMLTSGKIDKEAIRKLFARA